MSKPDAVAVILWSGATLYAVFGGADFGAGAWQLLAGRGARGERVRSRVGRSIGPVWEANHVWLIFALVVLWTGFPDAFAPIMETLYVPLALAAIGIVLRGSAFAFGHELEGAAAARAGAVFASSSILTPFFMGTVVGAIAAGEVPADGRGDPLTSWLGPLPLLTGGLFVIAGAYIAAIFLLDDTRRAGEDELASYFLLRARGAAVLAGLLALAGVLVLRADARFVYDGLVGEGLPLLLASAVLGGLALAGLLAGWRRALRPLSVGAVVAVIWGWGVAQHPFLLPETLTIEAGAAVEPTLTALIIVFAVALAIVGPSLALLYGLAQRQTLD